MTRHPLRPALSAKGVLVRECATARPGQAGAFLHYPGHEASSSVNPLRLPSLHLLKEISLPAPPSVDFRLPAFECSLAASPPPCCSCVRRPQQRPAWGEGAGR